MGGFTYCHGRICNILHSVRSCTAVLYTDELDGLSIRKRSAVEFNSYPAITIVSVNSKRIIRSIGELEVCAAPCNSSVCSNINIITRPGVRITLIYLEIRLHYAMEDHGICLTDTTAKFFSCTAIIDTASFLEALLCGSLADEVVKVERFAWLEYQSIDLLADQVNVNISVVIVFCLGA